MNNSLNIEEPQTEKRVPLLNEKEAELVKVIEAIGRLSTTGEWSTLKKYVFSGVLETLERRLKAEAEKPDISTPELYRLQGQIMWARRYGDLPKLADTYRLELINIRKQLNPPTERDIGS